MVGRSYRSIAEQVAERLEGEMRSGRWGVELPGVRRLATELGVNFKTVEAAIRELEWQGLLESRGPRRRRRIVAPKGGGKTASLRLAILLGDSPDKTASHIIELKHLLIEAGHEVSFAPASLADLGMDVKRVSNLVARTMADAWVVGSGSREILEWFSRQPEPVFALFGRRAGLPIASVGPDQAPVYAAATRRLLELGHRRIVLLCRRQRRLPQPGKAERAFLDELEAGGIGAGHFNLPDWEESRRGFASLLHSLFRHTPPTALLLDESFLYHAAFHFLSRAGLQVPEDVSLICTDEDPAFAWCEPTIAHIRWESGPAVRRVVRWVENVGRGKKDLRQTLTKAEFVDGGTVGQAPDWNP